VTAAFEPRRRHSRAGHDQRPAPSWRRWRCGGTATAPSPAPPGTNP